MAISFPSVQLFNLFISRRRMKTPRLLEKIDLECYSRGVYGDFNDALSPSRFTRCIHKVVLFPLAMTRVTSIENGQPENESRRTQC
jgi:hypothetical protein